MKVHFLQVQEEEEEEEEDDIVRNEKRGEVFLGFIGL